LKRDVFTDERDHRQWIMALGVIPVRANPSARRHRNLQIFQRSDINNRS
jgi:hypothetical protein